MRQLDQWAGVAALLAALMSTLSLFLTRRWQRRDSAEARQHEVAQLAQQSREHTYTWARDNLLSALVEHIQLSFKITRMCKDHEYNSQHGKPTTGTSLEDASALHQAYMDQFVYLRVLANQEIIARAERLHDHLDVLLDHTYCADLERQQIRPFALQAHPTRVSSHADLISDLRSARANLINACRQYLNMPGETFIGEAENKSILSTHASVALGDP